MLITSLNNEHIKELIKLKDKKYRDERGLFLVDTKHLVMEAYKAGLLKELILHKDEIYPLDVDITYVTNDILKKISQTSTPSRVMGLVEKKSEDNIIGERILILDNIQDPGNLGTIIRSAVAFNIDTVVLSDDTVDLYNPKVIRSSEGMIFHINIIRGNIIEFLSSLDKSYLKITTDVKAGEDVNLLDTSKCALVIGNEGSGVKKEVESLCDKKVNIKMNNNCESLNAGVSASILMYEVFK